MSQGAILLVIAVLAVGVLHTVVPDHWLPITLMARQRGWSRRQTARSAAIAGFGHAASTLIIAAVVWVAGIAFAARFGAAVDIVTSVALVAFGGWVAIGAIRELRESPEAFRSAQGHGHVHAHEGGITHAHWHLHGESDWHEVAGNVAMAPPLHEHEHPTSSRTALLLVLGSSPMVEGIPAFFAAAKYGASLIAIMAVVFAASTIATYVVLCVASLSSLERLDFGPFERYGEVLSGLLIAALGIVFLFIRW
jgi:ABC-type nickel/cobalt efflux system permease component RcnA